jgi:hypothetical protein
MNYNLEIAKIGAMFNALASTITNDTTLQEGEKFLLLQRIFVELKPTQKNFEKVEKGIKEFAKDNLYDDGSGKSEATNYFGAEVMVKYSYPKPTLDGEKLKTELERAYSELNVDFDELQFLKPTTPRQTVIIQSIL